MGQEIGRFEPGGENSAEMLARLRRELFAPPNPETTPLDVFIEGLTIDLPVCPSDTPRHTVEGQLGSAAFPFPPGLNMIWRVAQSDANPNFVVQRPSADTEEMTTILTITSSQDNTSPRFSVPEAPDFQTAVQLLIPYVLHRIPRPQSINQAEFDRIMLSIKTNLATIVGHIDYSQQNNIFEVTGLNFSTVSFALSSLSSALCALLPRGKEQLIREAFSADINSLS